MAILKTAIHYNFRPLQELSESYPDFNGMLLAFVGSKLRLVLRKKYLSGQDIDLRAFPVDRKGRYTVNSNVDKRRRQTKISAYPINFFERGRTLRDGRKEAGTFTITKKLKQDADSRMSGYISDFETRILSKELKKLGL